MRFRSPASPLDVAGDHRESTAHCGVRSDGLSCEAEPRRLARLPDRGTRPRGRRCARRRGWACLLAVLALFALPGCQLFRGPYAPDAGGLMQGSPSLREAGNASSPVGRAVVRGQSDEHAEVSSGRFLGYDAPPREMQKMAHPRYRIEAPDILILQAIRVVPKPPYSLKPSDVVQIVVDNTPPDKPIANVFLIDPAGRINLGPAYGAVNVLDKTITQAKEEIEKHLSATLAEPNVSITLQQFGGQQQIDGEHLVAADGTVNLGVYGQVFIAGLTISEAQAAIEKHLSKDLQEPQVWIDVFAYNSKKYYVILAGAGAGDRVFPALSRGNETVLDAVAEVGGFGANSSKKMWIARPAPGCRECYQILPIEWDEITRGGSTRTNYQLFPGDRLYVAEDRMVHLDNFVSKMTAPFERMVGSSLLTIQMIQTANRFPQGLSSRF